MDQSYVLRHPNADLWLNSIVRGVPFWTERRSEATVFVTEYGAMNAAAQVPGALIVRNGASDRDASGGAVGEIRIQDVLG